MAMQFYTSPEQIMRDRSEYARKGVSRGRGVVQAPPVGGSKSSEAEFMQ